MPTPKKHANAAERTAAYRRRLRGEPEPMPEPQPEPTPQTAAERLFPGGVADWTGKTPKPVREVNQ